MILIYYTYTQLKDLCRCNRPSGMWYWHEAVSKWCIANDIIIPYLRQSIIDDQEFRIGYRNDEDATLFKLKWL
jgi:hypothetical protein